MPDTVTVTTTRSWGSRIKGSFKGIFFGLILVVGSCWFLFKNEGRAVRRYKALKEGVSVVVSVGADQALAANEGKLVHTTAMTEPAGFLVDREFGVAVEGIHLERTVEMYQWRESSSTRTKKKAGGSTETTTTYSYAKGWSEQPIDSSSFREPRGHQNPGSMPYRSRAFSAEVVNLGAFTLSPGLIRRISNWRSHPVRSTDGLPDGLRARAKIAGDAFYLGSNPAAPSVGDLRVSFRKVLPAVTSVVARQNGSALSAYPTRSGGSIELVQIGSASADEMFEAAREANKVLTWILRAVGFFLMVFGFRLILRPLSVMADVWPALGNLAEKGVNLFAAGLAAPLSLLTIGIAWIFYRPLLAIGILLLTAILGVAVLRRIKKARREVAVPPPPPPAPA